MLSTNTDGPRFILPSTYPFLLKDLQTSPIFANPRHNAPERQMDVHCGRLPETGAKRPLSGAVGASTGFGGAAAAKLPDAPSLLSERATKSSLCVQDVRIGCTKDALEANVGALAVCSIGAILAT